MKTRPMSRPMRPLTIACDFIAAICSGVAGWPFTVKIGEASGTAAGESVGVSACASRNGR